MLRIAGLFSAGFLLAGQAAVAQDVRITPDLARLVSSRAGTPIVISRIQDSDNHLTGEFTRTSRPCPPHCIEPISAAPGVRTVGEVEVLRFLDDHVATGSGLLLDNRTPDAFAGGSIPGAVNVPDVALAASNPYRDDILTALGGTQSNGAWDFTGALDLTLFCNGPWCDQSGRAVRDLVAAGYPTEKLNYYRGGMQLWLLFGLTVSDVQ
ncbi:rhodanese-like domain-containing protein [Marinovum sp.]|uniref:rhodanese-like domain-containing protein n=1 Tax=Marinovum sp. TaxID=2024839 RepID=UPI003A923654